MKTSESDRLALPPPSQEPETITQAQHAAAIETQVAMRRELADQLQEETLRGDRHRDQWIRLMALSADLETELTTSRAEALKYKRLFEASTLETK